MDIYRLLTDEDFLKKDQFERRRILENFILSNKDCKIGIEVTCFEKEIVSANKYFYHKSTNHKLINLTVGNNYKILDHKKDKIKIENDDGQKVWYTTNRFIFSLKMERLEKLKKIKRECDTT